MNNLCFSQTCHESKDGYYGSLVSGRWNGLIGELVRDEIDIGIMHLDFTPDRVQVIDFSAPVDISG